MVRLEAMETVISSGSKGGTRKPTTPATHSNRPHQSHHEGLSLENAAV